MYLIFWQLYSLPKHNLALQTRKMQQKKFYTRYLKSSFNYNFVCNGNKLIPNITQYSQKCILQKNSLLKINLDIEYLTQEKSGNICYYVFFC